ncbi:hypothetical protein PHJA_002216200 [Phtheirospermum japonicum]|uniref:Uncharacterized protein n=1 Tax=Phtheirospermum japonicum TaxID=374723 RepID=A0A830CR98_9LAMI|nr:hypothetical protein PHJA_002216200 [Phtheirospermum japonicum]
MRNGVVLVSDCAHLIHVDVKGKTCLKIQDLENPDMNPSIYPKIIPSIMTYTPRFSSFGEAIKEGNESVHQSSSELSFPSTSFARHFCGRIIESREGNIVPTHLHHFRRQASVFANYVNIKVDQDQGRSRQRCSTGAPSCEEKAENKPPSVFMYKETHKRIEGRKYKISHMEEVPDVGKNKLFGRCIKKEKQLPSPVYLFRDDGEGDDVVDNDEYDVERNVQIEREDEDCEDI